MNRDVSPYEATIPNGTKVSSDVKFELTYFPCAVKVPILTTSTKVQFEVSIDNGKTFDTLYNQDGTVFELTVAPATGGTYALDRTLFSNFNAIRVKVADNQGADRVFVFGGGRE